MSFLTCIRCIEIHDLLQKMGREIVRQESPYEAGRRSRLWFHQDIINVLEESTVSETNFVLFFFPHDFVVLFTLFDGIIVVTHLISLMSHSG